MGSVAVMEPEPNTGISVLVVGGGIGGLTFAIEAYRKGHSVQILERRDEPVNSGEFIFISASGLQTPAAKWPGFMDKARHASMHPSGTLHRHDDGTQVGQWPLGLQGDLKLVIFRSKIHKLLDEYVANLGIPTAYSCNVVDFFETETQGGVILADGRKFEADVIVAADGVSSMSYKLVLGEKAAPINSGYVVHRTSYPVKNVLENPVLKPIYGNKEKSGIAFYAGHDSHMVIGKTEDEIAWLLTHKDPDGSILESWTQKGKTQDALDFVKDWCPVVREIVKSTPTPDIMVWRLMWRDPQPNWVSAKGRVVQIGDAAHPVLPTSGSGATIAMEDGISLATILSLAGKDRIPLALRVHNKLRFERVSCVQKNGFKSREFIHRTDWSTFKGSDIKNSQGPWQLLHDPEKYAIENFEACSAHILEGKPFENTNAVPGYKYEPWTAKELVEASNSGLNIHDEGDWFFED